MDLPKVSDRMELTSNDELVTDVTILAVDLNELIWTVWNHMDQKLEMLTFDENGNWSRVLVKATVTEDDEAEPWQNADSSS